MLCHEGADFSRVVTAMAKNSTTATSNVYHVHLHVSRQLLFVARTGIYIVVTREIDLNEFDLVRTGSIPGTRSHYATYSCGLARKIELFWVWL